MRNSVIILVGFALLGFGAISARAEKNSTATAGSLVGGQVELYPDGDTCSLALGVGRGDSGGTIGVEGIGLSTFRNVSGTCEASAAALIAAIPPAPLCATHLQSSGSLRLSFVCSGPRERVIGAIGELAKAMLQLP